MIDLETTCTCASSAPGTCAVHQCYVCGESLTDGSCANCTANGWDTATCIVCGLPAGGCFCDDGAAWAAIEAARQDPRTPCPSGKHEWCECDGPDFTCVRCGFVYTYEPEEAVA